MKSRSSLFLIEQLIVIAVFAVCAAVCVKIFVESHIISSAGADINNALLVAKNGAESFKSSYGDIERTAQFFEENQIKNGHLLAFYDHVWGPCREEEALYVLRLIPYDGAGNETLLTFGRLSVERLGDGALAGTIVELTVAVQ